MKKLRNRNNDGFTLAEVLVVCAIVALLAAIAIPFYLNSLQQAQGQTQKQILQDATDTADGYFQNFNTFYTSSTTCFSCASNGSIPDWPTTNDPEVKWVNLQVWAPFSPNYNNNTVAIIEPNDPTTGTPTGNEEDFYMYGKNGVFYCAKIAPNTITGAQSKLTYGSYKDTSATPTTLTGTDEPECYNRATSNTFPSGQ